MRIARVDFFSLFQLLLFNFTAINESWVDHKILKQKLFENWHVYTQKHIVAVLSQKLFKFFVISKEWKIIIVVSIAALVTWLDIFFIQVNYYRIFTNTDILLETVDCNALVLEGIPFLTVVNHINNILSWRRLSKFLSS